MERNFVPLVHSLLSQCRAWLKWVRSVEEGVRGRIDPVHTVQQLVKVGEGCRRPKRPGGFGLALVIGYYNREIIGNWGGFPVFMYTRLLKRSFSASAS